MSIASRTFFAAAFTAGLMLPGGGAQAAVQGFSIDLGTAADPLTLDWSLTGGLSAAAAASNGQPARELPNNGSYFTTLTGDYAVFDNLPPVNESILWRESYEITLNGHILFFQPGQIVGPYSGEDVWQAFLHVFNQVTGLPSAVVNVVIAVLEHNDHFSIGMGQFDYVYNSLNEPAGAFAVGTTESLGERIALNPYPQTNTLSFDFSLIAAPEPSTWAMLLLGFAGLGFFGYRQTQRAKPQVA